MAHARHVEQFGYEGVILGGLGSNLEDVAALQHFRQAEPAKFREVAQGLRLSGGQAQRALELGIPIGGVVFTGAQMTAQEIAIANQTNTPILRLSQGQPPERLNVALAPPYGDLVVAPAPPAPPSATGADAGDDGQAGGGGGLGGVLGAASRPSGLGVVLALGFLAVLLLRGRR